MSRTPRVLLVEDERSIRELVSDQLRRSGYDCLAVSDGREGLQLLLEEPFDAVVLDLMLPHVDGVTICRTIRGQGVNRDAPILMLTARMTESDKVLGLESGADDYVAKPYEPRELLARCKSVLRRSTHKSTPSLLERVRMGRHTLDLSKRELHDDEANDVAVTAGEFDILKIFAENPNRPLSRDWLLETTSHRSRDPFDRAIDLRITRIRRKIEPSPEKPTVIRTVRGVGYMFVPPAE